MISKLGESGKPGQLLLLFQTVKASTVNLYLKVRTIVTRICTKLKFESFSSSSSLSLNLKLSSAVTSFSLAPEVGSFIFQSVSVWSFNGLKSELSPLGDYEIYIYIYIYICCKSI